MKKAEMGINLIVVAAIALLILVILAVLVASKLGWFKTATDCGGVSDSLCADSCDATQGYSAMGSGVKVGCKEGQICCLKTGDSEITE